MFLIYILRVFIWYLWCIYCLILDCRGKFSFGEKVWYEFEFWKICYMFGLTIKIDVRLITSNVL